jgi:inositol polyphosphate 5-phosphatase INPP5B/F
MPKDDAADYVKIRDDWLWSQSQSLATLRQDPEQKQLMCVHSFRDRRERLMGYHRIRLGTFNVGGKLPSQDLSTWLGGNLSSSSVKQNLKSPTTNPEADILVVALQEVDPSTEALFYSMGPAREDAWTAAILAALGEKAEQYEKVTPSSLKSGGWVIVVANSCHPQLVSKQLVGILLIVFVKRDVRNCFTKARESSVAVGIMVSVTPFLVIHIFNNSPGGYGELANIGRSAPLISSLGK